VATTIRGMDSLSVFKQNLEISSSSPCLNRLIFQLANESDLAVVIYVSSDVIV
jgi:hypothetical protein